MIKGFPWDTVCVLREEKKIERGFPALYRETPGGERKVRVYE